MLLFLIIIQVCLNTTAQVLLKKGVNTVYFDRGIWALFYSIATNLYVMSGLFIFVASFMMWLFLLSKCELSYLYPFGSLSYILAAVAGWYFFAEGVTVLRVVGIMTIFVGVCCVAKS